jgi:hypothetical protein
MSDLPSREVIKEHEFEDQLSRLLVNLEDADDFIAGAEEMLARDPSGGMQVSPNGKVWYLPMSPVRGRRVSLFYSFDEERVVFLWIVAHDD